MKVKAPDLSRVRTPNLVMPPLGPVGVATLAGLVALSFDSLIARLIGGVVVFVLLAAHLSLAAPRRQRQRAVAVQADIVIARSAALRAQLDDERRAA